MLKAKKPMRPADSDKETPEKSTQFLPNHLMRDIRDNLARRKGKKSKQPED